jgi:uncharacterized protein YhfF
VIVRPEIAKLILQGKKSQHRRPAETNTCRYQTGKAYAIQPGLGKTAVCRITIGEVRRESLGDITLKDAKKEGYTTTTEFFDYWRDLHGSVDKDIPVWVISFQIGDRTDTPRYLAARIGPPHGDYVTEPALAASGEGEPVSDWELAQFAKLSNARDHDRGQDPLRQSRDRIAREITLMQDHLERYPNEGVAKRLRQLEAELLRLNRELAT